MIIARNVQRLVFVVVVVGAIDGVSRVVFAIMSQTIYYYYFCGPAQRQFNTTAKAPSSTTDIQRRQQLWSTTILATSLSVCYGIPVTHTHTHIQFRNEFIYVSFVPFAFCLSFLIVRRQFYTAINL